MNINRKARPILDRLPDGLVLCRSTSADAAALGDFNARIHSDFGWDQPDLPVAAWTRDLSADPHPTFHPDDFTIVAEESTGRIVPCGLCLILSVIAKPPQGVVAISPPVGRHHRLLRATSSSWDHRAGSLTPSP